MDELEDERIRVDYDIPTDYPADEIEDVVDLAVTFLDELMSHLGDRLPS